ncbi:MAG: glycosyltransferase, partial [Candidatus Helarchaeota archaeon]
YMDRKPRILGIVNHEPITNYLKKGFSTNQLIRYYNPAAYFDQVHIFACRDKPWTLTKNIHVHNLKFGFRAIIQLIYYVLFYKIDILRNFEAFHTHHITAEVKYLFKIPAIISLHDRIYPPTILAYDHILTYVESLRDTVIKTYNIKNVGLLLNRIDENLFKPGAYTKIPAEFKKYPNRIVTIARLIEAKNQEVIIRAMPLVLQKYPNTLLLLIGEGKARKKYHHLIKKLGLSTNIRIIGSKPQEIIVQYLNWCDFQVLIDESGNLGKALVETLVIGKPVIAIGHKGNSQYHLTDDFNAKMIHYKDAHNPKDIALAIIYMIENKEKFNRNKIRARAVREYGYVHLSNLEANFYEHVFKNYKFKKFTVLCPKIIEKGKLLLAFGPYKSFDLYYLIFTTTFLVFYKITIPAYKMIFILNIH